MNQEQLSAFSDPESDRMCKPFSFGEYTYSTNGHILVRVPRLADVPEWAALNEKSAVLFDRIDYTAADAAMVGIPVFDSPIPEKCPICKGAGKITTCPECDGDGEVTVGNEHHDYQCECLTCHGEGIIKGNGMVCHACNGSGKKRVVAKIPVGAVLFSSYYLAMLQVLPGIKIAPVDEVGPNYFKWDGGDGLLMPMRP